MRIIFIPGFGEDEVVFKNLVQFIEGEKLVLNSWQLLGNEVRNNFNAITYAKEFISKYKVTADDVLIGHSMGGWIAYHVKHLIGCRLIHISSMTHTNRIVVPVKDSSILYWAVKKGLVFNSLTQWLSLVLTFNNKQARKIYLYITDLLKKGDVENILNQLKVILMPVNEVVTVQPDLRIHAKGDTILKPPVEPYYLISGDHFTLYTNPEEVAVPVIKFLKQLNQQL